MGRSADLPRESGQTDGDDSGCPILHVDMDAFFASVEIRRRPQLRGRAVIVGGGQRGVVSAASYEARRYGVRSAMPMAVALRRCPHATVLPVDRAAYEAASGAVMQILRQVTPLVEPLSLDEAFLDVSGARRLLGRPADIARTIRARVAQEQQLTCSVGIAPTKFVAKVASARCKPDGLLVVPADGVLRFLHPLPVTALWGVGPSAAERLSQLGLRTVGDVARTPVEVLARSVGAANAEHLSRLAEGDDPRSVHSERVEKSISADRTFPSDLTVGLDIDRELLRVSREVAHRLRTRGMVARAIGIKVRFGDFRTVSRVRTLASVTDSDAAITAVTLDLYRALRLDQPRIRLLGVRAEALQIAGSAAQQLSFDDMAAPDAADVRLNSLDRVSDLARSRFGPGAVGPASLLRPKPMGAGSDPAPGRTADHRDSEPRNWSSGPA